jgi:hypothetical protein
MDQPPLDGLIVWGESKGEGVKNRLEELTGKKQTFILFTDHADESKETLLIYDGVLSDELMSKINAFATRGTEQFGPESRPNGEV